MSIFSWLFSRAAPSQASGLPSDGLTVPQAAHALAGSPEPAGSVTELKQQRQDRREHLYNVVRDVMLRSEVLASHYKFKVLSLDTQGRQFLIMIDLMGMQALRPDQVVALENLMAKTAAQRHELTVKAVYWRQSDIVAAVPERRPAAAVPETKFESAAPAPVARDKTGSKRHGFEPIDQDEVQAFKKAIASATPAESQPGQVVKSGPRQAPVPADFQDTRLLDSDEGSSPLGPTQFGDFK